MGPFPQHSDGTLLFNQTPASQQELMKPQTDKLDYKFITLENSLNVLLISDPETDKAAAAMDVNAGSLMDPPDVLGLAHFTEHMLFYSSEKYPNEDEYSKFISDHGGHTNAYTAAENTNYHFDVNWSHLAPALDRFAQFFISPQISEDGVDREVKAVDSEHKKNLNTDAWRMSQLMKHTANPAHPWAKFSTGDIGTLSTAPKAAGRNPRDLVVQFHSSFYSANVMRLVVLGREPVSELETLVTSTFLAVPNKRLPTPQLAADVFLPEHLCKLVKAVPQKEGHSLELMWPVPASLPLYRYSPLQHLSHLVGHEGEGSLFAALKAEGWASSLVAGESGHSLSSRSFFYVKMDLTASGHAHVPEVLGLVHRYLEVVREQGIKQEVFDEIKALSELRFSFRDKQAPYSYASSLSNCMQHYPNHHLLLAMSGVPMEYNEESIRAALADMVPSNLRLFWTSKDFEGEVTEVEPVYSTKYWFGDIPEDWMKMCREPPTDARLHMPSPNPFIPSDLSMLPPDGAMTTPLLVAERPLVRVRHQQEARFPSPKAAILLEIQSPAAYMSPENAVMTRLLVKLLCDYLSEVTYPAELAGLGFSLHNTTVGMQITVMGYHHKLRTLLDTLLAPFLAFTVREDRFRLAKEQLTKEYANMKYQQPYQWAMYRGQTILTHKRWTVEEYQQVLPDVTPATLQSFHQQLSGRCFVEALVVGNLPKEAAVKLADDIQEQLVGSCRTRAPFPGETKEFRTVQLPVGVTSRLEELGPNPGNDNSAVVLLHQVGSDDVVRNALADLLVQLGKRDAFHQLRTVEQLGYMVFLFTSRDLAVTAVQFVLQSAAYSADHLASRVEAFLGKFRDTLKGLTQDELDAAVAELAASKLEKPKRLREVTNRLWSEIAAGTLLFNRQEVEVEALRSLTLQQVVDFAEEVVLGFNTRRQLAIHIQGHTKAPEQGAAGTADAAGSAADADAGTAAADADAAGTTDAGTTDAAGTAGAADAAAESAGAAAAAPAANAASGKGEADGAAAGGEEAGQAGDGQEVAAPKVVKIEDIYAFKRACNVYHAPVEYGTANA